MRVPDGMRRLGLGRAANEDEHRCSGEVSVEKDQKAFVLRISPSNIDRFAEALETNTVIIGWSCARGLLDPSLDWPGFREILRQECYPREENLRRVGSATGNMWRFIREMENGSLVVVPHGPDFYVARVTGPAVYLEEKAEEDTAYRRSVEWLNGGRQIARSSARSALVSRMKTQGTSADASDLILQILECLEAAEKGDEPAFQTDLQGRLIRETLDEIRGGRMDSFGFERLVQTVLEHHGAQEAKIVPRSQDVGVDIYAKFLVAGAFPLSVAVQVKHWQPDPPLGSDVVNQLINGIENGGERVSLGMIFTSGTIADDAHEKASEYTEKSGIPVQLVSGEDFAKLIVEFGVAA